MESRRISHGNRSRRHAFGYDGIGADRAIISNGQFTNDLGARSDQDVIADDGGLALASAIADGDFVVDRAMVSKICRGVKNDAAEMVNSETLADYAARRN
jgi:hypothetical protein